MEKNDPNEAPICMSGDCPVPSIVETVNKIKEGQDGIIELLVEIKHVNKNIEDLTKRVYDVERKLSADVGALHTKIETKVTQVYNEISRIDNKFDNKTEMMRSECDNKIQTLHSEIDSKILEMDGKLTKTNDNLDQKISKKDIIIWLAILTGLVTVASFAANFLFKIVEYIK